MLFTWHITVPYNTPAATPTKRTLKLARGIISWVSVLYPTGCHGMVYCQIYHFSHQIFPSTQGMTIIGDGTPIEWNEYYEMYQEPYELTVFLWSPGTTYPHTVSIRVAILPRKAILALAIVDALKNAFGLFSPKRIFTRKEEKVK